MERYHCPRAQSPGGPGPHARGTRDHDHRKRDPCGHGSRESNSHTYLGRRPFLVAGAGTALALAGCTAGDGDGDVPDPVTLTDEDACEVCGMVIPRHPGPSAEIFYPGREPSGHANPARFDSTWEAFQYDFQRQDEGWERAVLYVTDYASVDYTLTDQGGTPLISTHPEREAFVDASEVTFVVASEVEGAMGRDLIGFSERSDAEAFRSEHGGELAALEDVTPTMISQLSGA